MANYRVISSDNHVFEPPDLWLSRIEPEFKDRAPRVVRDEDGGDWWFCDGEKVIGTPFGFGGAQTGKRFEEGAGGNLAVVDVFEHVRPGGYIPEEHVKDMDIDGVDVSILYPTLGLQLFKQPDSEFLTAIFRAYNDWLAEFCQAAPNRLKGVAMINIDDVAVGIEEMKRCRKKGLIGAMITVRPPVGRRYDSREYEPLWAAAQDLNIPLGLHLDTNRLGEGGDEGPAAALTTETNPLAFTVNCDHVGSVEHEISWAAHFTERLDYNYLQRSHEFVTRFKENMLPSDYFHRNVFVGFQEDALRIRFRSIIGVDSMQWGSDYPHHESTFPRSSEILEEILADCTEEEKSKIVGGNAARVYNL